MASNMMIGCDLAQLDDFTLGLLCNNEVNAVNQDLLGKQAHRDYTDGDIQVWSPLRSARPLAPTRPRLLGHDCKDSVARHKIPEGEIKITTTQVRDS